MLFANGDRETFVSVATLAAAIGRSEKTVRRALSRLYAAGEVTPRIEVTACGRRNVYTLTTALVEETAEPLAADAATPTAGPPDLGPLKAARAEGQNDPMGRDTVTRPPPPHTLLSDRDHLNDPPPPPLVVGLSVPSETELRVLAYWRAGKLPPPDEHRARVAIRRRVAEGVGEQELLDAVAGARVRARDEGWAGVSSAFAVVMACAEYVGEYARRGREEQAARMQRESAERERYARERALARETARARTGAAGAVLAKTIAAAAAGRYEVATRLAKELEREAAAPIDGTDSARFAPKVHHGHR